MNVKQLKEYLSMFDDNQKIYFENMEEIRGIGNFDIKPVGTVNIASVEVAIKVIENDGYVVKEFEVE